ncbi:MAG: hypothetical protein DRN30_06195 [Thermoplasmata archaeon]|nr:MAG: hypothetical protein DRN30_06195 [Thermoplasmata archaeon]
MNPRSLSLSNFLSYKEENIKFNEDGLVLITGINDEDGSAKESNGAGKSSIFDAILWSMFGRIRGVFDKELVKDDVIRVDDDDVRAKECRVEFIFDIEGSIYKVIRKRVYDLKTDLQFYVRYKKEWKSLTCSAGVNKRTKKRESASVRTENKIIEVINCNCDLFINSVLFEQGNTNTFAVSSKGERENLFKDALHLVKWEDYSNLAKQKLKVVKNKLNESTVLMKQHGHPSEIEKYIRDEEKEVKRHKEKIKCIKEDIEDYENEKEDVVKKLAVLSLKSSKISELDTNIRTLKSEIQDRIEEASQDRQTRKDLKERIERLQEVLDSNEELEEELKVELRGMEKELVEVDLKKLKTLQEMVLLKVEERSSVTKHAEILKKSKIEVKVIDCSVAGCMMNTEDKIKEKLKKINSKIFKLNKNIMRINKEEKAVKEKIFSVTSSLENNQYVERQVSNQKSALDKVSRNSEKYERDLNDAGKELNSIKQYSLKDKNKLEKDKEKLETLKNEKLEYENALEKESRLNDTLSKCKMLVNDCNNELQSRMTSLASSQSEIKGYKAVLTIVKKIKKEFTELQDEKLIIDSSINLMGKDIPHLLVENAIPEIEDYANDYLDRLSNGRMKIEFITEREIKAKDDDGNRIKSDTLDIVLTMDGKKYKYALYSGGEKTRADVAIHLGYSTFLLNRSGHRLQTLFLDEVCSALDVEGKEMLVEILQELYKDHGFRKIFLISQDVQLKRMIDQQIVIMKTREGSKWVK